MDLEGPKRRAQDEGLLHHRQALEAAVRQLAEQAQVNDVVRRWPPSARTYGVDVVGTMLQNGQPKDIFVADGLHMTPAGYASGPPLSARWWNTRPRNRRAADRKLLIPAKAGTQIS